MENVVKSFACDDAADFRGAANAAPLAQGLSLSSPGGRCWLSSLRFSDGRAIPSGVVATRRLRFGSAPPASHARAARSSIAAVVDGLIAMLSTVYADRRLAFRSVIEERLRCHGRCSEAMARLRVTSPPSDERSGARRYNTSPTRCPRPCINSMMRVVRISSIAYIILPPGITSVLKSLMKEFSIKPRSFSL